MVNQVETPEDINALNNLDSGQAPDPTAEMQHKNAEMLYTLGYNQAKAGLPLAFLDFKMVGNTPSQTRKKSLDMVMPLIKKISQLIIKQRGSEVTPKNLKYYLTEFFLLNGGCLTTSIKASHKTDITYSTNVSTINSDYITSMFKFYNDAEHAEVPARIVKALDNIDIVGVSQDILDSVDYVQVKVPKIDILKSKVTIPRIPLNIISLVPIEMAEGYAKGLESLAQTALIELNFLKSNGISRKIYYTLDSKFTQAIYNNTAASDAVLDISRGNNVHYFRAMDPQTQTSERGALTGHLSLPDLGNFFEQDAVTIMRKVNMTTVTDIKVITDVNAKEVYNLNLYANVDLDRVVDSFTQYISCMSQSDAKTLYQELINNPNTPNVKQDLVNSQAQSDKDVFFKYLNYYTMLDSTQAAKVIYKLMLDHEEMLKAIASAYEGTITNDILNNQESSIAPQDVVHPLNIAIDTSDTLDF